MITIISGTNRNFSKTLVVAKAYSQLLTELGAENQVFSLADLPKDIAFTYLSDPKEEQFNSLLEKYIRPVQKFVVIIPEYQGTFPGIFKLLLDGIATRDLLNKKIALVGVSSGRAGNLRGLDQLTTSLHYLDMHVYPNKIPVSKIRDLVNAEFVLSDEGTLASLKKQAEGFLKY
jgi:NAD(P)H-dependent FMN reductase